MTDNRGANPRFAFIPKSTWHCLLDFAPIPLASIAVWFSFRGLTRLVCILISTIVEFEPLVFAFGWREAIPTTFAWATGIYFVLDTICQRREKAQGMACEGFGRSALLVFSGTTIILLLLTLWCLDAQAPWPAEAPAGPLKWWAANSVCMGGAWAGGIVTAVALRRLGKRFEVICLLPPVACIAGMLSLALADALNGNVAIVMGRLIQHYPILLVAISLTACSLPVIFLAERRLCSSSRRAIGIACAGLWVTATALSARWLLSMLMDYSWTLGGTCCSSGTAFETHVAVGIALAFLLAACIRLWVSKHRVAAMAAKPADD